MTAEVAILNRAAVAVAADSAVTLGADRKVYKTANKIYPLSLDPPVLIMFYGAGSLGPYTLGDDRTAVQTKTH